MSTSQTPVSAGTSRHFCSETTVDASVSPSAILSGARVNILRVIAPFIAFTMPFADANTIAVASEAPVDITRYRAHIEPDIAAKSINGRVAIRFERTEALRELTLDAGDLAIESVVQKPNDDDRKDNRKDEKLSFTKKQSQLIVTLPAGTPNVSAREIEIVYRGSATLDLNFSPEHQQVYTAFSTSQWMPCVDSPAVRATFELVLVTPKALTVLGNGRKVRDQMLPDNKRVTEWKLDLPMPSYLYGFAAGPFREVIDKHAGKPALRYLTTTRFSDAEIEKIFKETRNMIAFYEEKSGVKYPAETYTQLLVKGGAGQEMSTYALMGERYGERVLANEKSIWLGAHELAHQWWGNAITNHDWREMWLNEGIATFMNVAFLEHRFGREEYLMQIGQSRNKYEKIRDAADDKSLLFPSWEKPTADDRSLVYDKGSYVVHLLREQLGEEKFWAGVRAYTQAHWGKSVRTADFKLVMEKASGQDLTKFFAQWVYQPSEPAKTRVANQ
jgi:aminopeptidase N